MMRGGRAIASTVALLCSVNNSLPAQDAPCTARTILATVVDQQGNVVHGLKAANFRGRFRGKPVEILSVSPDPRPPRIVIVMDASASMGQGEGGWDLVTSLAADIFRSAPSATSFALIVFSDTLRTRVGFTQNTAELAQKLAAMPKSSATGRTALYDALTAALVELTPPVPGDAIFAITDGGDNSSKTKPSVVKTSLMNAGVRFFAFMPMAGIPSSRTPEEAQGPTRMRSLAEACGGNLFIYITSRTSFNPSLEERRQIRIAVKHLSRQIWERVRLEVRLATPADKPRGWKLEVVDENGKANRKLTVLYPHGLMPCN